MCRLPIFCEKWKRKVTDDDRLPRAGKRKPVRGGILTGLHRKLMNSCVAACTREHKHRGEYEHNPLKTFKEYDNEHNPLKTNRRDYEHNPLKTFKEYDNE